MRFRTSICYHNVKFIRKKQTFNLTSNCYGHPFAYTRLLAFFSSSSSENQTQTPYISKFSGKCMEEHNFDEKDNGSPKFNEAGIKESTGLASFDRTNDDFTESCNFNNIDEGEDSSMDDEIEEIEGDNINDNDDFRVLDSYNRDRNRNNSEFSRRFEVIEDEMRHPLVKEVCRLISMQSNWTPKLEGEMRRLLRCLNPNQICAVLKFQSDERVALKFFYWADKQWRYRHYPIVYYTMLEILSKTKLCQGAKRILRLMSRRRIVLKPEAFGYLMVSYNRAGDLRKALQVLTLMQKSGIEPDLSICNTAIYVFVKGNKLEKAFRFLERMKIVGINPNVSTYNRLIKGLCDENRLEDALSLIQEMISMNCPPDKVSYYTVIGFLCKGKRVNEVRNLMEKFSVEQETYNTIIHMLSKHGHDTEALNFLREAEEKGFLVDKIMYSAIINTFCRNGNIKKAKELVHEMISKGCEPDVVTYTPVINGLCRAGETGQAKKLIQQMAKHGCTPNTYTYTSLLNGLCGTGKSHEAREMMKMSEEDGLWVPNYVTYSVVMHGFRREKKLHEACEIAREMISKGFLPNPVEINLLIQSLCIEGLTNEAKFFTQDCLNKGCAVNVVNFTTLIHGFCKNGDLESALSVLDDMYLINKHPDIVTYTIFIDELAKNGRFEEAIEMVNKMLHKGLIPTPVTYRTVIHRFCMQNRVNDLLKILEKMLSRQEFKTVYNLVIEKLSVFGFVDEAYELIGKVLRTGSRIDVSTCYILMVNCLKKGNSELAYKVACRMFNRNLVPDLKLCEKVCEKLMKDGKIDEADKLMLRFVERGCVSPPL